MSTWLVLIPLLPCAAALVIVLVASRRLAGWLAAGATGLSFVLACVAVEGGRVSVTWLEVGRFHLTFGLRADDLAVWGALLVSGIAAPVHVYSMSYMAGQRGGVRFFAWMSFFTGAMLALVMADSLLLLFVAWEAVGVASWALIGFDRRDARARRASLQALLMTRAADGGFLLAWLLVLLQLGTTDLSPLLLAAGELSEATVVAIALLLLIAVIGKSAQLPLSAWLPDAMVAPSPVSALIHSATMVAAGAFLVLRLFPLFAASELVSAAVAWTGLITALAAAWVATGSHDLKRLLAWSTISQLGEIIMVLGLGGGRAAAFHLSTHAIFKAELFLLAGALENATGRRDLRELGGIGPTMPWLAAMFVVAALALAGFPPFAGYWSEERVLAHAVESGPGWGFCILALIGLAGFYIGRAVAVILGRRAAAARFDARPVPAGLMAPMALLAVAALASGYFLRTPIESALSLGSLAAPLEWPWRTGAIVLSATGLLGAAAWVRLAGAEPLFGALPGRVAGALGLANRLPAGGALRASSVLASLERVADAGTRAVGGGGALRASAVLTGAEDALNAAASRAGVVAWNAAGFDQRIERALDELARAAGAVTRGLAVETEHAETRGVSRGVDRAAASLGWTGSHLRAVQTGKLYLYTMSAFGASLLAGLIAVLVLLV